MLRKMNVGTPCSVGLWRLQRIHGIRTFKVVALKGLRTVKPLVLCVTEVASGSWQACLE